MNNANTETTRTLADLAKEAIDVQNACNLSGVAQGFARAMLDLGRHVTSGTDARNRHPIAVLWTYKAAALAGIEPIGAQRYFDALQAARALAEGKQSTEAVPEPRAEGREQV